MLLSPGFAAPGQGNPAVSEGVVRARAVAVLLGRIGAILLLAAGVAGLAFLVLGPPTLARGYQQDEIARFAPRFGHGFGQLLGESVLVGLVAYVARRWLRVHL